MCLRYCDGLVTLLFSLVCLFVLSLVFLNVLTLKLMCVWLVNLWIAIRIVLVLLSYLVSEML